MTNREKFITKCNEYDLMMQVAKGLDLIYEDTMFPRYCPIYTISGKLPDRKDCFYGGWNEKCGNCIQRWLNEES